MKTQLTIYLIFILIYVLYNQFFRVEDEKLNIIINILFASLLFLYMSYMAFVFLRKMKKKK